MSISDWLLVISWILSMICVFGFGAAAGALFVASKITASIERTVSTITGVFNNAEKN
jgi:hypothetical protein